jgi:hypothetical protein
MLQEEIWSRRQEGKELSVTQNLSVLTRGPREICMTCVPPFLLFVFFGGDGGEVTVESCRVGLWAD